MPAPTVHRDVTASGVRLRVAEAGEGEPIVFVHGLFANHACWESVMTDLAPEFRVVAPDLPGFGASEKPPANRFPYSIDAFAEAIADLYAGLRLGRAVLVGHALGGAAAITLAAQHPELVSRLVLVNSSCYEARPDFIRRIAVLPVVGGFVFKQFWGRAAFGAYFRDVTVSGRHGVSPERVDAYYESFNSPAARGSALATLRATVDTRSVVAHLSRLQAPTLVVWGRHDRRLPARQGQRLAREIRDCGFELVDSGHAPHEERPGEVSAVIRRFVNDERPSGVSSAPARSG